MSFVTGTALTDEMTRVLTLVVERGALVAGKGEHKGRVERISATTLKALERRGLVTLHIGPDGGMMARPVIEAIEWHLEFLARVRRFER